MFSWLLRDRLLQKRGAADGVAPLKNALRRGWRRLDGLRLCSGYAPQVPVGEVPDLDCLHSRRRSDECRATMK